MTRREKIEEYRRWNFEVREDQAYVCYGCHEKSSGCVWVPLSGRELIDIVNDLRSIILENLKGGQ